MCSLSAGLAAFPLSPAFASYGRYIPNLTRQDGSALEALLAGTEKEKGNPDRHNHGHND
jgi:hypothetical protein